MPILRYLRAYVKPDVLQLDVAPYAAKLMAKLTLNERLGRRCRALRNERGISQMDMVRFHDFSLSHYQKIERGVLDPRLSTLEKIAKAFKVDLSELLDGV